MKAPAQGAATSIHLASAPDLERVTGRYFARSKPRKSSKRSYDRAAAARLWQVSADLSRPDRSRIRDQPGRREGRLKPRASYLVGSVRVLGEDFHGPGRSRSGTYIPGDLG